VSAQPLNGRKFVVGLAAQWEEARCRLSRSTGGSLTSAQPLNGRNLGVSLVAQWEEAQRRLSRSMGGSSVLA